MKEPICISLRGSPPESQHGAYAWTIAQFGRPGCWGDDEGWRASGKVYLFYAEKDAMHFLLRWPGKVINDDYVIQGLTS